MTTTPFLIIETGQPVASMRRHGSFAHWIRVAAGLDRDDAVVVDVEHEHELPSREGFAGVIVTGSAAMVPDRHPWSERTAEWLRDAAHAGLPLLGICYGHQLIAHALGGEVGANEAGREMGTVRIHLHPAAQEDPLFAGLADPFAAQATHLQSVLRPPADAIVLAHNDHDACHAFRWGRAAWGVQFHPEFSAGHMRGYIRARHDALARENRCGKQLAGEVHAAPQARRILRRFVAFARSRDHAPVS
ncbi:glutamine amidotransferase [Thermomonas carbonis]|uniref:Glutamine amidotransferase n=1 Tax=Thermomonas carbonis TaxID=1463158 RepID=A0A7G9SSU2_9GAMM|nr:glutamine amidotransferase [Thermomonas carbonis]QNN70917.1 glutamine amidotransferase [Thermomonas carbonis]GHC03346.1 GMP synthase [Thermomonas carbonis]